MKVRRSRKRHKKPSNTRLRLITWLALLVIAIALPIIIKRTFFPTLSEAGWWDEGWTYRKKIPVSNNTTQENDVYIEIAAYNASDTTKYQTDCGDMRFTKENGELLPYHISSCGASTTIHIQLDTFLAGDQNIYLYYGNAQAPNSFETADFSTEASNYTVGTIASEEITPGPIAYWKFDERVDNTCSGGTNDICDSTTNQNDGAINNSPEWMSDDMCISESCFRFDSADTDYLEIPDSNSFDVDSITIEAWIKTRSTSIGSIVMRDSSSGGKRQFQFRLDANGKLNFIPFFSGTADTDNIGSTSINDGAWHHIAATYDEVSGNLRLYVDGVQDYAETEAGTVLDKEDMTLLIGKYHDNGTANFDGFIDEVKIYRYARSADQIKNDYLSPYDSTSVLGIKSQSFINDDLHLYMKFDESNSNSCPGGSNDSCDSTELDNDGLWNNNANTTSGKFGPGITLDGTDDYVSVAHKSSLIFGDNSTITISAWIKPDTLPLGSTIVSKGRTAANYETNYTLRVGDGSNASNNKKIQFYYRDSGDNYWNIWSTDNSVVNNDGWYHVVTTYTFGTGSSIKTYINGSEVPGSWTARSGNDAPNLTTDPLWIGAMNGSGGDAVEEDFDGKIDELRIYGKILTQKDILNLYNAEFFPGPVGYWPMDENTGTTTTYDKSGNSNNGTLTGSMTEDDWVGGKIGSALDFDGSNDYLNTGTGSSLQFGQSNSFSISAWIKSTSTNNQYITSKMRTSGANVFGYETYVNSSGKFVFSLDDSSQAFNSLTSTTSVNDGAWHYVTATYDSSSLKIYIDGVLENTTTRTISTGAKPTNEFVIGVRHYDTTHTNYFTGSLDEVKVYNYTRTPVQVIEDMNANHPIGGFPISNQLAYWSFDESYGQTIYDANNNYNGTRGSSSSIASDDPTWKTQADCKINGCLSFTTGDYVEANSSSDLNFDNTDSFTITSWVKSSSPTAGTTRTIIQRYQTGSTYPYLLKLDSNNNWQFSIWDGTFTSVASSSIGVDTNWHHIAGVRNVAADTLTLYVDGIAVDTVTDTTTGNIANSASTKIGAQTNAAFAPWLGEIDEVKIYSGALTPSQILVDMNAGSSVNYGAGTNESASLTDGAVPDPIGYWDFNENTGTTTAYDKGTGGNDGTLTGSMTENDWVQGKYGSALDFDGSNDYITLPANAALNIASNITLSAWIKTSSSPGGIIDGYQSSNPYPGYGLDVADGAYGCTAGVVAFYSSSGWKCGDTIITDGLWHHVLVAYDDSVDTLHHYIDGVLKKTTTSVTPPLTYAGVRSIGARNDGAGLFDGQIDEAKIWNTTLTQSQVSYEYNRGRPIAHWKLDECQGSTAYDASGNDNHGTITIGGSGSNTSLGTCSSGTSTEAWNNGTTGKRNSSLDFDGTDDQIVVTTMPELDTTAEISITAWVNLDAGQKDWNALVARRSAATAGGTDWILDTDFQNEKLRFVIGGANYQVWVAQNEIPTGEWTHITATYTSAGGAKFYYNGVEQSLSVSQTSRALTTASSNLYINYAIHSSTWNSGKTDDLKIYNYALSSTQIKNIMNGGAVNYGP